MEKSNAVSGEIFI